MSEDEELAKRLDSRLDLPDDEWIELPKGLSLTEYYKLRKCAKAFAEMICKDFGFDKGEISMELTDELVRIVQNKRNIEAPKPLLTIEQLLELSKKEMEVEDAAYLKRQKELYAELYGSLQEEYQEHRANMNKARSKEEAKAYYEKAKEILKRIKDLESDKGK